MKTLFKTSLWALIGLKKEDHLPLILITKNSTTLSKSMNRIKVKEWLKMIRMKNLYKDTTLNKKRKMIYKKWKNWVFRSNKVNNYQRRKQKSLDWEKNHSCRKFLIRNHTKEKLVLKSTIEMIEMILLKNSHSTFRKRHNQLKMGRTKKNIQCLVLGKVKSRYKKNKTKKGIHAQIKIYKN